MVGYRQTGHLDWCVLVILHCSKHSWWKTWLQSRVISPLAISAKQIVHCGKFEFWSLFFFALEPVALGFLVIALPLLRVMMRSGFWSAVAGDLPVLVLLLRYVCICTVKIWDVSLKL